MKPAKIIWIYNEIIWHETELKIIYIKLILKAIFYFILSKTNNTYQT